MNISKWGLILLFCFCQTVTAAESNRLSDSELQVLRHYEGVWDCNFAIEPQEAEGEAKSFTGVVEGKWVVGDQFLEQTGSYRLNETSAPFVIRTMMSFDKKQNRYHYEYFMSSGETQSSFGKWNAESKKMTSTMTNDENGNVTTIVADFGTQDVERWTIETRNRDGKLIGKILGTNTRRKKE